jgi:predicted dehydrogenase
MAVKTGIISFAHMHAAGYAPHFKTRPESELVGIADADPARGKAMAEQFEVKYFDSTEALLAEVEAVAVCTENALHRPAVELTAKAGVHVLCEKPLAASREDAVAMVAACSAAGVQLMTAFPCRFSPAFAAALGRVEGGELGRILALCGTNRGRNPGGWFVDPALSGGGTVMDHTVHVADLIRTLTGEEIEEVFCEYDTVFTPGLPVEDCGILSMKLTGGAIATLDCSWSRPPSYPTWGDVTLSVIAEGGNLFLDLFSERVDYYRTDPDSYTWAGYGFNIDGGMVADFLHRVQSGEPMWVSGVDGLRALEVVLAAYESARTRQPVKVERSSVP